MTRLFGDICNAYYAFGVANNHSAMQYTLNADERKSDFRFIFFSLIFTRHCVLYGESGKLSHNVCDNKENQSMNDKFIELIAVRFP